MKIEIDMNDIFLDEDAYAEEPIQDSVKRKVLDHLAAKFEDGLDEKMDAAIAAFMQTELAKISDNWIPNVAQNMLDTEYQPVDKFGDTKPRTTFRQALTEMLKTQLVYDGKRPSYEKNAISNAVDDAISKHMREFKKDFDALATDKFRADALSYAVGSLKKSLGIE